MTTRRTKPKDAYEDQLPEETRLIPLETDRLPKLGDWVLYVLPDAFTVRPALVVNVPQPRQPSEVGQANLQVFVDGSADRRARGAHADATLTDYVPKVPHVEENEDGEFPARSWHWPT